MFMCVRALLIYHRRSVVTHRSFHGDIQTVVKKKKKKLHGKNSSIVRARFYCSPKSCHQLSSEFSHGKRISLRGRVPTRTKHFPKLNFGSIVTGFRAGHVCRSRHRLRGSSAHLLEMRFECVDCKYGKHPGCPSTAMNTACGSFSKGGGGAENF